MFETVRIDGCESEGSFTGAGREACPGVTWRGGVRSTCEMSALAFTFKKDLQLRSQSESSEVS